MCFLNSEDNYVGASAAEAAASAASLSGPHSIG